jgi:hypothetical protein
MIPTWPFIIGGLAGGCGADARRRDGPPPWRAASSRSFLQLHLADERLV